MKVFLSVENGVPIFRNEVGAAVGNIFTIKMNVSPSEMTMDVEFSQRPTKKRDKDVEILMPNPAKFVINNFGPLELDIPVDDTYFTELGELGKSDWSYAVGHGRPLKGGGTLKLYEKPRTIE